MPPRPRACRLPLKSAPFPARLISNACICSLERKHTRVATGFFCAQPSMFRHANARTSSACPRASSQSERAAPEQRLHSASTALSAADSPPVRGVLQRCVCCQGNWRRGAAVLGGWCARHALLHPQ
eukprot:6206855-Pleurochrysis_carterae.AAC.3